MEYQIKNCPSCKGELHIPVDMNTCICMYCGEKIDLSEIKPEIELPESAQVILKENYQKSLEHILLLIEDQEQLMNQFSGQGYQEGFQRYVQTGITILQPAERYASIASNNFNEVIDTVSDGLIGIIGKEIDERKGTLISTSKAKVIEQYRFFLTVYLVPMIRYLNYTISEPLSDRIIEKWRLRYPKFAFHKGDYESLQAGFEKKGLCFITTAVCETMGKADDCYELTAFRNFRDVYMTETEDRQELVNEYYKIAPMIVTAINLRPDYQDRYRDIWNRYLQRCLQYIEQNRYEQCEKHYVRMVRDLKKKFCFSNS